MIQHIQRGIFIAYVVPDGRTPFMKILQPQIESSL